MSPTGTNWHSLLWCCAPISTVAYQAPQGLFPCFSQTIMGTHPGSQSGRFTLSKYASCVILFPPKMLFSHVTKLYPHHLPLTSSSLKSSSPMKLSCHSHWKASLLQASRAVVSQPGAIVAQHLLYMNTLLKLDIWQSLETFLVVTTGVGGGVGRVVSNI